MTVGLAVARLIRVPDIKIAARVTLFRFRWRLGWHTAASRLSSLALRPALSNGLL